MTLKEPAELRGEERLLIAEFSLLVRRMGSAASSLEELPDDRNMNDAELDAIDDLRAASVILRNAAEFTLRKRGRLS